jgi:tRNA G18 (ribose-2'-O)-methylase SpoU
MRKLKNDELGRVSVEEFQDGEKHPFALLLDNVRSLHNVGSAFRTADAFKAAKVYLCGITGTPPNREIQKTALGATESVAWEYAENTLILVQKLKNEGWKIIAVEQADKSTFLPDFIPDSKEKYAFVFGNEVFGVAEEVVQAADLCIEIPQFGTKHSLNIAVSIGVIAWDFITKLPRIK